MVDYLVQWYYVRPQTGDNCFVNCRPLPETRSPGLFRNFSFLTLIMHSSEIASLIAQKLLWFSPACFAVWSLSSHVHSARCRSFLPMLFVSSLGLLATLCSLASLTSMVRLPYSSPCDLSSKVENPARQPAATEQCEYSLSPRRPGVPENGRL